MTRAGRPENVSLRDRKVFGVATADHYSQGQP